MPSLQARFMNRIFKMLPQDPPGTEHDYAAERERNAQRKPPKAPRGVTETNLTLAGMNVWKFEKDGNTGGWVFYIHGGGFTTGSIRERSAICQYIAANCSYNCIGFDYRLAPENKWPAQIDDCLSAYKALEELGITMDRTVFMGESAGGTLVLSLALRLKELGLAQPKVLVSFSPCVNQAEHYPSHAANAKTDYMLRDAVLKGLAEPVFGKDAPVDALKAPTASPVYGDFEGLPPVFLSASDTEALFDDSRMLYKKLKAENHKCLLDVQHGVCHAFQMFPSMPEAKATLKKAFDFIASCR